MINPISKKSALELFCGAGGTSLGFEMTGDYDVEVGVDFDPDALMSFQNNHQSAQGVLADLTSVKPSEIGRRLRSSSLDVLIGGPSCQGYSTIGKRIADDPRNSLYTNYLDFVDELRPRWIVFENVRGFLHSGKGKFYESFRDALEGLGYDVVGGLLNVADYGVPQRRERVFLVGTNTGATPCLPAKTHGDPRCPVCSRPDRSNRLRSVIHFEDCDFCMGTGRWHEKSLLPWVSLRDAIGDLPYLSDFSGCVEEAPYQHSASSSYQALMRKGSKGITLHKAKPVSNFAESIISKVPPGKGIRALPENELPERFRAMRQVSGGKLRKDCTTLYGRLDWEMPSYTITCYFGNVSSGAFTHPEVNRSLTPREAARLQSFPDTYVLNPKNVMRQLGNAVPPLMAQKIAKHIVSIEAKGETPSPSSMHVDLHAGATKQAELF